MGVVMKHYFLNKILRYSSIGVVAFGFAFSQSANAGEMNEVNQDSAMSAWSDAAVEAWRQGKLETIYTLNDHLSALDITTEIDGHMAVLTGSVKTEVQRELAEQLALSVDGISDVKNDLVIDDAYVRKASAGQDSGSFMQAINDAGITASVKTQLIASDVKARNITVDTENGVVTLIGSVDSEAHSDLAQTIAKNTEGVFEVNNNLMIMSGVAHR